MDTSCSASAPRASTMGSSSTRAAWRWTTGASCSSLTLGTIASKSSRQTAASSQISGSGDGQLKGNEDFWHRFAAEKGTQFRRGFHEWQLPESPWADFHVSEELSRRMATGPSNHAFHHRPLFPNDHPAVDIYVHPQRTQKLKGVDVMSAVDAEGSTMESLVSVQATQQPTVSGPIPSTARLLLSLQEEPSADFRSTHEQVWSLQDENAASVPVQ